MARPYILKFPEAEETGHAQEASTWWGGGNRTPTSVGGGVQERKIDFGPGYRVYLGRDGDQLIILLAGGTKKRQNNDIADAIELWKEYKQRKKGETGKWHSQKTLKKLFRLV